MTMKKDPLMNYISDKSTTQGLADEFHHIINLTWIIGKKHCFRSHEDRIKCIVHFIAPKPFNTALHYLNNQISYGIGYHLADAFCYFFF